MPKGAYLIGHCNLYGLNSSASTGNVVRFASMYVKLRRTTEMPTSLHRFAMLLEYFDVSINRYVHLKIEGSRLSSKDTSR